MIHRDKIVIKGARVHNLKNIDIDIPKDKLVVITGVSGSGKSSLAFDTIYAEGQRRYVESLSAYARQFLGLMDKPDLDYIEGLSPAISIDQKAAGHNPRSTVGTVTEIYDYLRLLYARVGKPHSPITGQELTSQTVQEIVDMLLKYPVGSKIIILSPIVKNRKGTYEELFNRLLAQGYTRAKVDGQYYEMEEEIKLDKFKKHSIDVVIDRLSLSDENLSDQDFIKRVTDSIEAALNLGEGEIFVENLFTDEVKFFSENLVDPSTGESFPKIEPHSFSFNSPHGACVKCNGLGTIKDVHEELIYNPNLSVTEGGIYPWARMADNPDSWNMKQLESVAREEGFDIRKPLKSLSDDVRKLLFYGSGKKKYTFKYIRQMDGTKGEYTRPFEGVISNLMRRYSETDSDYIRKEIEKYMKDRLCEVCNGRRLNQFSLAVTINEKSISAAGELPISDFKIWIEKLQENKGILSKQDFQIAKQILQEIGARTDFLLAVGLDYLTINRTAKTLSGGESQRIRLASQIGTGLTGVLYVLDEPSIGLHQEDNDRLIGSLENLRDIGNSVIVVEHDEDTIRKADFVIDIGPEAGVNGGNVVATGTAEEIAAKSNSLTAQYLNGKKSINKSEILKESLLLIPEVLDYKEISAHKQKKKGKIVLSGVEQNNLKNVSVEFPLGKFVCVTGVSGSGKSSLINDVLYPALHRKIYNSQLSVGKYDTIEGLENLDKVVEIDQSPIGRTPRSNPATYTGVFTAIRELFANTREAKTRGYSAGRFSFNTKGGRCENCKGDGVLKIEMQFLADVYVTCEVCEGKRYNRETLQIDYKGKNIAKVLEMTVAEACEFFGNHYSIVGKLETLLNVGLGYVRLGQSATTLSGGEAQRVKLASELSKRSTGRTIYILDEPTTGLHFEDVRKLLIVLHSLVLRGNSVVVIEHNLDLVKTADYIIDLGPKGGVSGGQIIATGTPEEIASTQNSVTGKWLAKLL